MGEVRITRKGIKSISVRGFSMRQTQNEYWPLEITMDVGEFHGKIRMIASETLNKEEFGAFVDVLNEMRKEQP